MPHCATALSIPHHHHARGNDWAHGACRITFLTEATVSLLVGLLAGGSLVAYFEWWRGVRIPATLVEFNTQASGRVRHKGDTQMPVAHSKATLRHALVVIKCLPCSADIFRCAAPPNHLQCRLQARAWSAHAASRAALCQLRCAVCTAQQSVSRLHLFRHHQRARAHLQCEKEIFL